MWSIVPKFGTEVFYSFMTELIFEQSDGLFHIRCLHLTRDLCEFQFIKQMPLVLFVSWASLWLLVPSQDTRGMFTWLHRDEWLHGFASLKPNVFNPDEQSVMLYFDCKNMFTQRPSARWSYCLFTVYSTQTGPSKDLWCLWSFWRFCSQLQESCYVWIWKH